MTNPKRIDPEDAKLTEAGFNPSAPAAEAIAKLRTIHTSGGISALAIARALGNIADPGAAAMLSEMEPDAGGALRREIRRALYKLHQRGIEAPAAAAHPSREAVAVAPDAMTALLSPIDAEGARIVWILKPRVQGGVLRLWGLASDDFGLLGVIVGGLTRRELKAEREDMERRASMRFVEADWHLADFILCEAWRRTPESRRGRVGNFLALRAELISAAPPTELAHPIYAELGAEAAGEPALELLKEPEILEWKLTAADILPYVEELNRANESVIVLNPIQQRERINQIVEGAVGELFTGERGARIRRRFEDTAYYMLHAGRRQQAGWAASAASQIAHGADLKRSLFFQSFVRTQLGAIVAEEQHRAQEEPRLIVTPAEAMRASEASRHRR